MNPDLDLTLERVIRAPRRSVWTAWTEPARLAQWWVPAPARSRVERLDVRPGGGFVTRLSDDGVTFVPHVDACFVVVDDLERIVFTNAIDSAWRPATPAPVSMTAEITFGDHPDGTDYRVVVRHGDPAARAHHEKLGFVDGWASVTGQLAALVEGEAAR
jgi:uncharacterized protein YndB with AHSA1/START domain